MTAACRELAAEHDLFVSFRQPAQQVFAGGNSYTPRKQRKRIGNGKHKSWYIDYQTDPPQKSMPNVIGTLVIKSHTDPTQKQFGGWDYGKYSSTNPDYEPKYSQVNLGTIDPSHTWEGMGHWFPHVLSPELLELSYVAIREALVKGQDPLPFENFSF